MARARGQPMRPGSAYLATEKSSGVSAAHIHAITRAMASSRYHGSGAAVVETQ
jgi:hypothetical protein